MIIMSILTTQTSVHGSSLVAYRKESTLIQDSMLKTAIYSYSTVPRPYLANVHQTSRRSVWTMYTLCKKHGTKYKHYGS